MDLINIEDIVNKYTIKRYLNRQEILVRIKPQGYQDDFQELWEKLIEIRKLKGNTLPLKDQNGSHFWYMVPPFVEKNIYEIDFVAKRKLEEIATKDIYKELIMEILIDEAFYSSVIEGAFSTKKRTKELVQHNNPKNNSEQMILNNFHALQYILSNLDKDLDEEIFIKIHKMITHKTLKEDEISEKYRDDIVYVSDPNKENPIYIAPKAEDVQWMMEDLFAFINDESLFINPIIKAFIIHFYIGYVHPFFDGNGRVARAFSYMYLLKHGYDFFKFFSISSIINKHRSKYYKSYKDTEDFESDLTYFISIQSELTLESMMEVIQKLHSELNYNALKDSLVKDGILLSPRQLKFLRYISKKENNLTTIEEYLKRSKVSYETARRDMMELEHLGIFKKLKKGKKFVYIYHGLKGYLGNR